MLANQSLKLADEFGVEATGEVLFDALFEAGEPELLEPVDLDPGEALVFELGERRPAPEGQRLSHPSVLLQSPETAQIELVRLDTQEIARRPGL